MKTILQRVYVDEQAIAAIIHKAHPSYHRTLRDEAMQGEFKCLDKYKDTESQS